MKEGKKVGMADKMYITLGRMFILSVSTLPHIDLGRTVHLLISSLILTNNLGPFVINISVIGEIKSMPKYFIPLLFQIKGVPAKCT